MKEKLKKYLIKQALLAKTKKNIQNKFHQAVLLNMLAGMAGGAAGSFGANYFLQKKKEKK
jgi:asparagine synthetase A